MCLPCRTTPKPAFSRARTASRWLIPGSFGTSDSYVDFADLRAAHQLASDR
jgi:hypothetical protein